MSKWGAIKNANGDYVSCGWYADVSADCPTDCTYEEFDGAQPAIVTAVQATAAAAYTEKVDLMGIDTSNMPVDALKKVVVFLQKRHG